VSSDGDLDLDRIVRIAEFRAELRTFMSRSEDVSRRWGLTPQRYLLLLMIKGAPDRTQRLSFTELAERLKLSRNSVTELVTRAEELGLVRREPASHDARVVYVRLTEDGDRRVCGALKDSDEFRREIATAFARLTRAFRGASRSS
jgi:DNA-binding MarR family transcriptional regulator